MARKKGALIQNLIHVEARFEPLDALSRLEFDVTLAEAHKFGVDQATHPQSGLRASGLMLPVGSSFGVVGTQQLAALPRQIENGTPNLLKNGAPHKAIRNTVLAFIPPYLPAVRWDLGLAKMTQ